MTPELIVSSEQMDDLLTRLSEIQLIAVDTEFFRETSYYPQLALVQIATADIVACVDPLAFDARPGLQQILLDQQVTKIFHSCSQDMEVLYYYLGSTPRSIYDTQIASALLDTRHQIGYAALVADELGVQLDKSQTRTNWLQRPLTEKQLGYAGDDVLYLSQLHAILEKKLEAADRKAWFDEDSSNAAWNDTRFLPDSELLWKRVKGINRMSRKQLVTVQAIAEWREQLARDKDITRRRILADDIIVQLALEQPEDKGLLRQLIGQRYHFDDIELDALLDSITSSKKISPERWPDNRFDTLDSEQKSLLKQLQRQLSTSAEELGISTTVICARKELEKLILLLPDKRELLAHPERLDIGVVKGWRYHNIGKQLIETLVSTADNAA